MALALLLPLVAADKVICALGSGAVSYKVASDQRPSADALELAARTTKAAGTICGSNCPQVVLFRNSTAANLMLLFDAGRAKVVYAPQVFTVVYDKHGDAGIMALLAHEVGHALDDAIGASWIEKSWNAEMRADAWAGCVMARSGLSQAEVLEGLAALDEFP